MKRQVDEYAASCFDDFIPDMDSALTFAVVTSEDLLGYEDDNVADIAGLCTPGDPEPHKHAFTKWSRTQLLSLLGTREKWFDHVSIQQQVAELSVRATALEGVRIRTRRPPSGSGLRILRGLVSRHYADIPDPLILSALCNVMPGGRAVRFCSGKTDRALYAYCISDAEIYIPGTKFIARPGVVVVNSEVGYTSLWVRPLLFMPQHLSCVVMRESTLLRRVHRGTDFEIEKDFTTAMEEATAYWGTMDERLAALEKRAYPDEDTAAAALYDLVLRAKGTRLLADHCRRAYAAQRHPVHNAASVFTTLVEVTNRDNDVDARYDHAAIAGAVLAALI